MIFFDRTTKGKFVESVLVAISEKAAPFGFKWNKKDRVLEKCSDNTSIKINFITATKGPPRTISLRATCSLWNSAVGTVLMRALPPDESIGATFYFPLNAISAIKDISSSDLFLDWDDEQDCSKKVSKIVSDIEKSCRVAFATTGLESLYGEGLKKIPFVSRVYPAGIEPDFRICLPRVAAIARACEGNLAKAEECVLADRALSMEGQAGLRSALIDLLPT